MTVWESICGFDRRAGAWRTGDRVLPVAIILNKQAMIGAPQRRRNCQRTGDRTARDKVTGFGQTFSLESRMARLNFLRKRQCRTCPLQPVSRPVI